MFEKRMNNYHNLLLEVTRQRHMTAGKHSSNIIWPSSKPRKFWRISNNRLSLGVVSTRFLTPKAGIVANKPVGVLIPGCKDTEHLQISIVSPTMPFIPSASTNSGVVLAVGAFRIFGIPQRARSLFRLSIVTRSIRFILGEVTDIFVSYSFKFCCANSHFYPFIDNFHFDRHSRIKYLDPHLDLGPFQERTSDEIGSGCPLKSGVINNRALKRVLGHSLRGRTTM